LIKELEDQDVLVSYISRIEKMLLKQKRLAMEWNFKGKTSEPIILKLKKLIIQPLDNTWEDLIEDPLLLMTEEVAVDHMIVMVLLQDTLPTDEVLLIEDPDLHDMTDMNPEIDMIDILQEENDQDMKTDIILIHQSTELHINYLFPLYNLFFYLFLFSVQFNLNE